MSANEVDESSPTLAKPFPLEDPVSPTDVIGAVLAFVIASLGVAGVPEAFGLTPGQVAALLGVLGAAAASVRHLARMRARERGV